MAAGSRPTAAAIAAAGTWAVTACPCSPARSGLRVSPPSHRGHGGGEGAGNVADAGAAAMRRWMASEPSDSSTATSATG